MDFDISPVPLRTGLLSLTLLSGYSGRCMTNTALIDMSDIPFFRAEKRTGTYAPVLCAGSVIFRRFHRPVLFLLCARMQGVFPLKYRCIPASGNPKQPRSF